MTSCRVGELTSLIQASDARMAMLVAAQRTMLWTVPRPAEIQACARLKRCTGDLACDSVSKRAEDAIRTTWPKSPVAAGESAIGSILHGTDEKIRYTQVERMDVVKNRNIEGE